MRFKMDRCETVIVDDAVGWFMWQNKEMAPAWLKVRKMERLPAAPPRVKE
jgi:hypothetical protein